MENVKNSICLFDVDGTLTESRRRIDKQMLDVLRELSFTTEIGLLTGSGLEYIKEQLWPLLADKELSLNCHVLPCNGTEYYIPNPESPGNFIEIHRNSMEVFFLIHMEGYIFHNLQQINCRKPQGHLRENTQTLRNK